MISAKVIKTLSVSSLLKLFFILKFTQQGPPGGLDNDHQRDIVCTGESMKGEGLREAISQQIALKNAGGKNGIISMFLKKDRG